MDEDGNLFPLYGKKGKKHRLGNFASGETIFKQAKEFLDESSKTTEDIDPLKNPEDVKLYKPRVKGKDYYTWANYGKVPKAKVGTGFKGSRAIGKTMKIWLDNDKTKFKTIKTANPERRDKKNTYERESAGILRAMDNYGRQDNNIFYTPLEERRLPKSLFKIRHVSNLNIVDKEVISRSRRINGFINSTPLAFPKPFFIKQGIWMMIHFRIFPLSTDKEVKKIYKTHYYWVRENNVDRIRKRFSEELTRDDLHGVQIQITTYHGNWDSDLLNKLATRIFPASFKSRSDFYDSISIKYRAF